MSAEWPWTALDLTGPQSLRDIKRAYAKVLKTIDRNDPEQFQALLHARDRALKLAQENTESTQPPRRPSIRELHHQSRLDETNTTPPEPTPVPPVQPISTPPSPDEPPPIHKTLNQEPPIDPPQPLIHQTLHDEHASSEPPHRTYALNEDHKETVPPSVDPQAQLLANIEQLLQEEEYTALSTLFRQSIFQKRTLREQVEQRLATCTMGFIQEDKEIPYKLAVAIDEEFAWTIDPISAKNRLFKLDMHDIFFIHFPQALNKKTNRDTSIPPEERLNFKSIVTLLGFLSLPAHALYKSISSWQDEEGFGDLLTQIFAQIFVNFAALIIAIIFAILCLWFIRLSNKMGMRFIWRYVYKNLPTNWQDWLHWQAFDLYELKFMLGILFLWIAYIASFFNN